MKATLSKESKAAHGLGRLLYSVSVWKKPPLPPRESLSIPELISAYAADFPDAPAVVMGDQTLTYRELELQSNRLARRLLSIGAEHETVVGLYLERSPRLPWAPWAFSKLAPHIFPWIRLIRANACP
jgi:non-ribosomal peptide synthetase component F